MGSGERPRPCQTPPRTRIPMASRARNRSKHSISAFVPTPAPALLARSVRECFSAAVEHHLAGRIADAEAAYGQVLTIDADHPEALNNLGVLLRDRDTDSAHELFERAVLR